MRILRRSFWPANGSGQKTGEKHPVRLPYILSKRDLFWDALIGVSAFIAVTINLVGLLMGITVVIPHLLYIPVVYLPTITRSGDYLFQRVSEDHIS